MTGLLLWLGACTPVRPQLTLEPGVSLADYEVFVVAPVTNETGEQFNLPVTDSVRWHLAERLRSHHFVVITEGPGRDSTAPAVIVTSALVGFRGLPFMLPLGGPGAPACELHAVLTDRQTGRKVGRVAAAVREAGWSPMSVINSCARDVGDAIARAARQGRKD
jgi:hypothetical protein